MYGSYAVIDPEGSFASGRAEGIIFFIKNLLPEQIFYEKEIQSTTLPQAHRAMCPGRRLGWNRPRNLCDSMENMHRADATT
jgi:hypothetical protein